MAGHIIRNKKRHDKTEKQLTHFSIQVLDDQSAYIFAAGSSLASSPITRGLVFSVDRPSATSAKRPFAMPPARMTLHVGGSSALAIVDS